MLNYKGMPPHLTDIFEGVLGIELGFSCFKTNTSLIDRFPQPLNNFLIYVLVVLEIELMALHMLGRYSINELHCWDA